MSANQLSKKYIELISKSTQRHKKRIDKTIRQKTSYASDTKWFKFFSAMDRIGIFLPESRVKFLANERMYEFSLKSGFDEDGILDNNSCGPFLYKDIEWIYIPSIQKYERLNR